MVYGGRNTPELAVAAVGAAQIVCVVLVGSARVKIPKARYGTSPLRLLRGVGAATLPVREAMGGVTRPVGRNGRVARAQHKFCRPPAAEPRAQTLVGVEGVASVQPRGVGA